MIFVAAFFIGPVASMGQYPVQNQAASRYNPLDASAQFGPYLNAPTLQRYPTGGYGNLYITGNVTAGKGFRGYVPYSDPTQFRAPLGSSALSGFESNAPNLGRVQQGYLPNQAMPFYNSSSTILPLSAQRQGLTLPGSSIPRTQVLPEPQSYGLRAVTTPPMAGRLPMFPENVRPSDILIPSDLLAPDLRRQLAETTPEPPGKKKETLWETQQKELQAALEPGKKETTLQPTPGPAELEPPPTQEEQPLSEILAQEAEQTPSPKIIVGPQRENAERAQRMAVEGQRPGAMGKAPGSLPQDKPILPPPSAVTTLAGRGRDAFTQTMTQAQRLMNQGRFYDACQRYTDALTIKPTDPLPLIGQAHALIAAGELRMGAQSLEQGLRKFPKFLRLKLDGPTLMGGKSVLDRRRENLRNLAQKNDTPEVRLLLGYVEILSGNREQGMQQITKSELVPVE